MSINKFNSEGYYDPTAYEAMTAVEKEERALRAFRPIVYICSPYAGDVPTNVENARKYRRIRTPKFRITSHGQMAADIIGKAFQGPAACDPTGHNPPAKPEAFPPYRGRS